MLLESLLLCTLSYIDCPTKLRNVELSAYTASIEETDDTPRIMADGTEVFEGAAACPSKFAFKTKFIYNGKIYECHDRMNKRYRDKLVFDLFFEDKADALKFGRRKGDIIIIPNKKGGE